MHHIDEHRRTAATAVKPRPWQFQWTLTGAIAFTACPDSTSIVTSPPDSTTEATSADESTSTTSPTSSESPTADIPSTDGSPTADIPSTGESQTTSCATATAAPNTTEAGESSTDSTSATSSSTPLCGDGVLDAGEACDDGNANDDDACLANCVMASCGDGLLQVGVEACDDGNAIDDDACTAVCEHAACGDGLLQVGVEACDDGNAMDGDGCEADCSLPSMVGICGDGVIENSEACDDGNTMDGDGCEADCTLTGTPTCAAPIDYVLCDQNLDLNDKTDKTQVHRAMGICDDTAENSVQIADFVFEVPSDGSWQVARGFGTFKHDHDFDPNTPDKLLFSPREGDTMLMISTGLIAAPDGDGVVKELPHSQVSNNSNLNPDVPNSLPAPLSDAVGSNDGAGGTPFMGCDGVHDCSDTLNAQWNIVTDGDPDPNDMLFFKFTAKVPEQVHGYRFNFVFCSSEWPEWVNTQFNDLFIVWQHDPTPDDPNQDPPSDPYTGNIAFIPDPNNPSNGLPLTITALDEYYSSAGFIDDDPQLAGTGFERDPISQAKGYACSDWFEARGGVQPGAEITLGFFLADMGDGLLASQAILDNFRWDCAGCVPTDVDDCGVQLPPP